ncbi:hypothetical protein [Staphylococcus edaphicus]|uniref:Helix-turn-helix type 11 domain-containing protein n=1 Tax=Staphylococcus edaphicus TaxID=1955013 RepID=A0A2C6U569_9STAP|nr:hypothetical protein [Staphylococcus edaphicus]PHK49002.1 hypothetical protein BTJ66_10735 [Staphylococcus edaphicus]UQW80586.1 hypothetical protein MNY58_08245 [Staphylococcus edaphicus]
MEKPERFLYIYTRLINGKTINKETMSQKLDVNMRSIQRDISDINHFIYEDQEWNGLDGEVVYDHSIKRHRLEIGSYNFKNNRLLNLIFRMKGFNPVIHEDTYNLIRAMNVNSNLAEKLLFNKLLSQFKILREGNESTLIYKIQLAIENNYKISIKLNDSDILCVIPIYVRYFSNLYWMTYLQDGEIFTLDLSTIIDVNQTSQVFERSVISEIKPVTILVKDDMWEEIKRQFVILDTQPSNQGRLVNLIISKEESLQLAYEYPQSVILLHPQHYVDEFKLKIKSLFNHYQL